MTAPTHKQYAICGAFFVAIALYRMGLTEINYYLALPLIILVSKYGALFPDLDHDWCNVKNKNVPNWVINKVIRITGGRHRSWQTHSIDIVILLTIAVSIIPVRLYDANKISLVNKEVMSIILIGFMSGWVSHILSDMLTSSGVRILFFWKKRISLVPKRLGRRYFKTGADWESFCYKTMRVANVIIGLFSIAYPIIYNGGIEKMMKNDNSILWGLIK